VRELRNAVEAAIVVGPHAYSDHALAPSAGPSPDGPLQPYKDARAVVVREFERDYLTRLLADANGNVSQAARAAKMDRSHLIDLLHRHGLKD
jgi:DNA-binding NtrC family response regulator